MIDARLIEIYRHIQRQRDELLAQILRVLDRKAVADPEISEVIDLLLEWIPEFRRERVMSGGTAVDQKSKKP